MRRAKEQASGLDFLSACIWILDPWATHLTTERRDGLHLDRLAALIRPHTLFPPPLGGMDATHLVSETFVHGVSRTTSA
jgi:hypothetical protein